jgi:hypothetical protein
VTEQPSPAWIAQRVEELTGRVLTGHPRVIEDTTDYMAIDRDHIVALGGELFLVKLTEREKRFGLAGEPKFWVKRAISLHTGRVHVLKMVFEEVFRARVGTLEVICRRDPPKEARVLEVFRDEARIMDGRAVRDSRGNLVRILDFIRGRDLITHLLAFPGGHEEYYRESFPAVLAKVIGSLEAIATVHAEGLCHGDIRNDHILVEEGTGAYRWIDFDVSEDTPAFDVWSVGNVLHFVVGRGFVLFREVIEERPELAGRFSDDDASVFFPNRIMNLRKAFPYLSERLNAVLLRFSIGSTVRYERVDQIVSDLCEVIAAGG